MKQRIKPKAWNGTAWAPVWDNAAPFITGDFQQGVYGGVVMPALQVVKGESLKCFRWVRVTVTVSPMKRGRGKG